jgi:REP-associated tyrosine transposase
VSQTHSDLLVHIVFSTKNREPVINPEMQEKLNAYLAGITRDIDGYPILFNGASDHVHGLVSLPPKVAIAKAAQEIKAGSSRWIHEHWKMKSFAWQSGYGAFSVSRSQVPAVADYIRNQQEHHKKVDFKQEYILLLKKHGVEYDERYIWT